jgi:hypothetical protein
MRRKLLMRNLTARRHILDAYYAGQRFAETLMPCGHPRACETFRLQPGTEHVIPGCQICDLIHHIALAIESDGLHDGATRVRLAAGAFSRERQSPDWLDSPASHSSHPSSATQSWRRQGHAEPYPLPAPPADGAEEPPPPLETPQLTPGAAKEPFRAFTIREVRHEAA